MFEAEAQLSDIHFGHHDAEGPVTFVLKVMLTAQKHGNLTTSDIASFMEAMRVVRGGTKPEHFIEDSDMLHPAFDRCWASLKPNQHRKGGIVTREVREFLMTRMKTTPSYGFIHYHLNGQHGHLQTRSRDYKHGSIEQLAMRRALRLYEDLLVYLALEWPRIRQELDRILKLGRSGNALRERAFEILAEKESKTAFEEWAPLRKLLDPALEGIQEARAI